MKCTVVKPNGKVCGAEIRGMTGLQELHALGKHVQRCHGSSLGLFTLAELRVKMEDGELIYEGRR